MVSDNFIYICCFFLMFVVIPIRIKHDYKSEFDDYLQKFNKSYSDSADYDQHFQAFKASLATIETLNTKRIRNSSAHYGLTFYSDMTPSDFLNAHLQMSISSNILYRNSQLNDSVDDRFRRTRSVLNLPKRVDWRDVGVISGINNQKQCGACWAFTVIETVEAMYALQTGNLTKFSVQEMIDCAQYSNNGCNGGDMCKLLRWLTNYNITIERDTQYPLTLKNDMCRRNASADGVKVGNFVCKNLSHDEGRLLSILANHGPVVTAINALTWQNYLGGVIQYHCDDSPLFLNHAVQIVGYDLSAEIPHYIVRNSWGPDFGEDGFLYVSIGQNTCGIGNEVIALDIVL